MSVYVKPTLPVYDNGGAPKLFGANSATTDNLACIAWHSDWVARAQGDILPSYDEKSATMLGDVFSAEVFFGAAKMNTSAETGVAALIQG